MPVNVLDHIVAGVAAPERSSALTTILIGGLVAGAFDITAACINGGLSGRSPIWIFQSVAGGLFGRGTFQGGLKTAVIGLILHFFIATMATTVYFVASSFLPFLRKQAIICGPLYGIVVYLFMYSVVLPLSALKFKFFNQAGTAIATGILIHIFCVGLPIALIVRKFAK